MIIEAISKAILSKYALLTDLLTHIVQKYRGETADGIDALYSSFHTNANDNSYYKALIFHNVSYDVLGGGTWYLEGFRNSSLYGWQKATCYGADTATVYKRSLGNGVWTKWERDITTADLINYLLNTGGEITADEAYLDFKSTISNRTLRLTSTANGSLGLYDVTNGKWILCASTDGTNGFDGIASGNLPITGGTLRGLLELNAYNNGKSIFVKNANDTLDFGTDIRDTDVNNNTASIRICAKNRNIRFGDTDGRDYNIFHEGNSNAVKISSTAPSDTTALWVVTE